MQKLQLSIPEPCHENWQQMTPTDQGRFCNACAKEVVDFSMMTDTEVLNYFTALTHDKVCGRALPSQLERTISKPKDPKKRLFWYWNYIVMFFMFFGKGNAAKAQGNTQVVTAADLNKIKQTGINNALAGKVGEVAVSNNRIITGKVTDKDGNPISFASIKIKGTSTGVSADANGKYSVRINTGAILEISGASFTTSEIPTGTQSVFNTVLEKGMVGGIELVTVGGAIWRDMDEYYGPYDRLKRVAVIQVKDEETGKAIPNASLMIQENYMDSAATFITDKKGMYKIKGITDYDEYEIKVSANGYEPNEFTIDEYDFKDRKKEWKVLLRKQKNHSIRSNNVPNKGSETIIRMGTLQDIATNKEALFVVDGNIVPNNTDINPDDVEEVTIWQGASAAALFGPDGANGAILITTRKSKEIKMNELVVSSAFCTKRVTLGGIGYTNTYEDSFLGDTIATVKTLLTDSIKIYPNPVQRNTGFSVALKLKQAGNYSIQVTDASGRILFLQKFNAGSKNHIEKIMSDSRWAGGVYHIRVFDAQNKLVNKSSFIVQ
jgi:TonB-dependent SusC/RagA subfamily outer membrane receptor